MRVVFDTSVLVAAARSRRGASYALVSSIPAPDFQLCLSVSLYLEMVLELAFAAGCRHIVTHNVRDFDGSNELGIAALLPREFLNLVKS